jgi:flavin reductase (DIM6/NTAB) family NADH-FMN oxidoreductase RutF
MKKTVTPEQLKEAMRAWITGVAIITGCHDGISHGMTANSFNSIALSPPTVTVALQQGTRTQNVVKAGGAFGVSILDISQETLARRFAGQFDESQSRFDGVETFCMVTGVPLIKNGLAYLDCKVTNTFDVGASSVFIGEVLATRISADGTAPLLYFNRRWRKLADS